MPLARTAISEDGCFHAMALQMDWPIIPIMTVFFGILTICAGVSLVILMHRGLNHARLCLLLCILSMYGATAMYWILTLQSYSLHVSSTAATAQTAASAAMPSLRALREEPADASSSYPHIMSPKSDPATRLQDLQMCSGTAALVVSITLGDGIVWWRAWVVCARKTWVLCLAAILLLSTAAVGIAETAEVCSTIHRFQFTLGSTQYVYAVDGALFLGNFLGFVSSMVTLLTNVVATSLIGYRAWAHSRMVREFSLSLLPSRSGVQWLLALLIESGILYCFLWILVVAFQAILTTAFFSPDQRDPQTIADLEGHAAYVKFSMYLIEGALVPLIAIYPTAIVLLVTLGNSCFETAAAHTYDQGASPAGSLPLFIQPAVSESECDSESPTLPLRLPAALAVLQVTQIDSNSSVATPSRTSFSVEI